MIEYNKAIYTATEVACGWAGAVMQKSRKRQKKLMKTDQLTNRPTD